MIEKVIRDFETRIGHDRYQVISLEYMRLASKPELSDQEAERFAEILSEAEMDEVLNYWLNEVDYVLSQRLDLLDKKHSEKYENQQAWLREYLGSRKLEEFELCHELQKRLKKKGYYQGPEDGVYGKDSQAAVKRFQKKHRLQVDGIVGPKTLMSLANTPEDAQKLLASSREIFSSEE